MAVGNHIALDKKVDVAGIDGILTVAGVIMAFSTFDFGKKLEIKRWLIMIGIFVIQAVMMIVAVMFCFIDFISYERITVLTMILASASLLINLFSWFMLRLVRGGFWGVE